MCFCFAGTHALVKFIEDKATVITPVSRISANSTFGKKKLVERDNCCVMWSNKTL